MMFRPRESHDLRLLQTRLDILPVPADLRWLHDVFDNSVAIAVFDAAATLELRFDSTVTLEHLETTLPDYALEHEAQTYPFNYSAEDDPDLTTARARHYRGDEVREWAGRFLSPIGSTDTMALLQAMTFGIKNDFVYVPRSEKGVQPPEKTLRLRSGSCRDFALFMMEAVRSLGLAARFVSGYIFVADDDRTADGRRRCHSRLDAGLFAGRGLGRFRSDQQHHRQPQSNPRRRRLGSGPGIAAVGKLHRRRFVICRHGRSRQRVRSQPFRLRAPAAGICGEFIAASPLSQSAG